MKIRVLTHRATTLASLALLAAGSAFAADSMSAADKDKEARAKLDLEISAAANTYSALQEKSETAAPAWVIKQAKGVLILTRWSGAVGVGGTGGSGIGMKKNANGTFSAPVFYTVAGGSLGLQVGAGKTETIAFLMSDKALRTLTDSKFVWSGNVRAVAGSSSTGDSTVDNTVDVILYQRASGLDVGATVAATQVAIDNESNRVFYQKANITPMEIFSGEVSVPDSAKPLLASLNSSAPARGTPARPDRPATAAESPATPMPSATPRS